jgi:sugar (pentulose or hexulose) kinase
VASGGALAQSPYWLQSMADVLGEPVLVSREPELTSRGTAILAWRGLDVWKSLDEIALKLSRACVPDTRRSEVYGAAIERQQRLYDRVIGR